ncbi:response regulator transcription factor [Phenylobacterium sp.]|uniref:response regulator transcription factor n=1 Tax=Phenylobacterium sp. TaxID=1871053 RepID=UPI00301C077F
MTSVLIADDHPLMLDAVAGLFADSEFEVVARCQDGAQALASLERLSPQLAILDVHMPRLSGLELLREVRARSWPTRVLLLTAGLESAPILEALRLRVDGLVLKGAAGDVLVRAARSAADGVQWVDRDVMDKVLPLLAGGAEVTPGLTPRETEVVRLVAQGRRNKEIARHLGISEGTVKMHLHNLYEKLSVTSRTELAILARERNLG